MSRSSIANFDGWAHLASQLRGRPAAEKRALARSLGVEDVWEDVDADWAERLRADVAAGAMDRPERYRRLCRDEQLQRGPASGTEADEFRTRLDAQPVAAPAPASDFRARVAAVGAVTLPEPGQEQTQAVSAAGAGGSAQNARDVTERWSVEQYARLCADLARAGGEAEKQRVWAACGVTAIADQLAVQRHWALKIAGDAGLRARWGAAGRR